MSAPEKNSIHEELERMEDELAETKRLLDYTRNYADRLLEELHIRVEEIQMTRDMLVEKNQMLTNSIECARHVLRTVRNPQEQLAALYPHSFSIFQPRDVIGGDFFWVHPGEDVNIIAVADCTGHGVAGAMVSMMAEMIIKQAVIEMALIDPAAILETVDKLIKQRSNQPNEATFRLASDISIDMLVAVHHCNTPEVRIASAHLPYFWAHEGKIQRVKGSRHSVGFSRRAEEAKHFETQVLAMAPNDMLYFSSDGFFDQQSDFHKKRMGFENMTELLSKQAHRPCEAQAQSLISNFFRWKGAAPQTDDVMLLGIRF
jgi:serine phosphatase RsbU (regulator of sigma subunit)